MRSENVHLRALEPEDLSFLYRWENDPMVWKVSNTVAPFSKYVLRKYIETSHLDIYETKQQRFVIVDNVTNLPVGTVDLFDLDPQNKRVGIGILIYDEKQRGKGYASQAVDLLLGYCFKILDMHQVFCNITTDNIVSMSLFAKKGFSEVGVKKDWIRIDNCWMDEVILQKINPY